MASAKEALQINLEARFTNAKEIVNDFSKQMEKGMIDASERALHKMNAQIKTGEAQLAGGDVEGAAKTATKLNNAMMQFCEVVNTNAGGAASGLAKLTAELSRLEQLSREIEAKKPNRTFRIDDSGQPHYLKSAVNRAAIGYPSQGKATFKNGSQIIGIDYGGPNYSNTNAMHAIVRTMNAGKAINQNGKEINVTSEKWIEQFKQALEALGYTLQRVNGKWTAELDSKRLEKEYNQAGIEYKQQRDEIDAKIAQIQDEIRAERLVVDNVTVTGDEGSFSTAPAQTAAIESNQQIATALEQMSKEEDEAAKNQARLEEEQDKYNKTADKTKGIVGKATAAFFSYHIILRQLRRLWNDAINTVRELDTQLTNQAIVTDLDREATWNLVSTYQELGRATGFTTTQIAAVNTEYLRQGNSLKDALTLTEAAAKAARVAGIDARQSVEYLTTAIHGFRLEAEDALAVSDKFAALAADSASDYEDLAIALSKVASQASLAGMSMDYTLALLTTGLDITQEAPESIGTALKTVIARMREIGDYGETLEDGTDINQVEAALKYVNIELRNTNGELRSSEDVLDELGRKWETLSANQQAAVAKALAGTRQQSRLVAILDNYQDVIKYQNEAALSVGATNAQMQEYLEGMDAAMNRLHVAYESFITSLVNNDLIMWVVDRITDLVNLISKWVKDKAGGIAAIAAIISILAYQYMPKIIATVQAWLKNVKDRLSEEQKITAEYKKQYSIIRQAKAAEGSETPDLKLSDAESKQIEKNAKNANTATYVAALISGAISATAFLIQGIIDIVDQAQNGSKKIAEQAISAAQEIQGKIYDNRKMYNSINSLTNNLEELDKRVIKTADDLKEITKIREELIQQLAGNGDASIYEAMSNTQLQSVAQQRKDKLDEENRKNIEKLSKTLLGAAGGDFNWGNVGKVVGAGAGIGAGFGGAIGGVAGTAAGGNTGAGMALGAGIGALVGTFIGGTIGIIQESIANYQRHENQQKVHELLKKEEGVQQVQTLLAYQYNDAIDTTTQTNKKISDSIKSTYSALIASLDGAELETLLKKFDYNSQALSDAIMEATKSVGPIVRTLDDENASYADRIKTARKLYEEYTKIDKSLAESFYTQYETYFDIYNLIGDLGIKYLDQLNLSLTDTNDLIAALQEMQQKGVISNYQDAFYNLMAVMADELHTVDDLVDATNGWSYAAVQAASRLIAAGNTLDSVAASITSTNSNIKNIRETQQNWGNMSATERQQWRSANAMLFQDGDGNFDPQAWRTFIEGGDMTAYIQRYKAQAQEQAMADARAIFEAASLQLRKTEQDLAVAKAELAAITDTTSDEYKTQAKIVDDLRSQYAGLNAEVAFAAAEMEEAAHIGELSLSDIVDKQSQQIAKLKEMYQAEEKALTDSLEKRKKAYEKYFNSLQKAEALSEYAEQRDQLINTLSRLSAGTDASSRTRVNELRKQLVELEKDQAKKNVEDARQALFDNIDTQIEGISAKFDELLNNNEKLLASMNANTHMQYLTYLASGGATAEERQLAEQQMADLLKGSWNVNGLEPFTPSVSSDVQSSNNSYASVNITSNGQIQSFDLSQAQMADLMEQIARYLQRTTGLSVRYGK